MIKLSDTSKQILIFMAATALLFLGIGAFTAEELMPYVKGLLFGTIFSMMKLLLLERTLNKALEMGKNAANYTKLHYSLRYFLSGVVLVVGALDEGTSLVGIILGFLTLRIAVYFVNIKIVRQEKLNK